MYNPHSSPATFTSARVTRVILLLLILFAFALRVIALDRLGIAYDEAASALMARATPREIIAFHWQAAFEHPPFWALLLHAWSNVAGQSEFALRLLPTYAGTLIVVLLGRVVCTIWPRDAILALMSAAAVALAPVLVYYSQEARMYTLVVALMLLATYLVLRLRIAPAWWRVFSFWITCWMMLGLHYYAALALAIQAAVLGIDGLVNIFARRPTTAPFPPAPFPWVKLFDAYVGALLPVVVWVLWAPGFHTTLEVVLDKAGENPVSWRYFLGDLWRELTFGSIRWQPDYATWGYMLAPLVVLGGVLAVLPRGQSSMWRMGVWMVVALVVLPILSGTLALRTLVPRYILWIVPLLYVLAALPAAQLWRWRWWAGIALFTIVVGVDTLALQYYFGPYRKSDFRAMTEYLQAQGDPARDLLLLEAPRQHLLTKYYLPTTWEIHPMPTLPLPEYWPVTAPLLVPEDEDDRIQAWLAARDAIWVSYSSEAEVDRGEFLAKYLTAVAYREHCTQWLDARLCHYVSPQHLTPVPLEIPTLLFGDELALTAFQGTVYHPTLTSTSLLIQLDWHAQQKPSSDYKVSLRLLAADGSVIDEADDFPIGPLLPPTTWNAGDRKPGYVALRLPSDLTPGHYPIQISLYNADTLAPTPYLSNESASTTAPFTLAEVQVDDTMQQRISIKQFAAQEQ